MPTTDRDTDDDNQFEIDAEVQARARAASERGEKIWLSPWQLIQMMNLLDKGMNADSGNAEADALHEIREALSVLYEDPSHWLK